MPALTGQVYPQNSRQHSQIFTGRVDGPNVVLDMLEQPQAGRFQSGIYDLHFGAHAVGVFGYQPVSYTPCMATPRIIAGAMSGTSADGVDIALVRIDGKGLEMSSRLIRHHQVLYSAELKTALFDCRNRGEISLATLASLARAISLTYADAVNQSLQLAGLTHEDLTAIAAHGQTLFHDPPDTIQWLDPALVAAETNCAVISDFRRADCAAGGQGAPLVPFADYILFSDPLRHRVLLNLGGIANITYLPAAGTLDSLLAFDTGPGNCISDFLMRYMNPEGPGVDLDGTLAAHGMADEPVVLKMLADPFFKSAPPKSTDAPQ